MHRRFARQARQGLHRRRAHAAATNLGDGTRPRRPRRPGDGRRVSAPARRRRRQLGGGDKRPRRRARAIWEATAKRPQPRIDGAGDPPPRVSGGRSETAARAAPDRAAGRPPPHPAPHTHPRRVEAARAAARPRVLLWCWGSLAADPSRGGRPLPGRPCGAARRGARRRVAPVAVGNAGGHVVAAAPLASRPPHGRAAVRGRPN